MKLELEECQLRQMIFTAAEQGAKHALVGAGIDKTEINKAEAYRRYSRRSVDGWIKTGKITPIKRGTTIKLNVLELDVLAKTNQLVSKHLRRVG